MNNVRRRHSTGMVLVFALVTVLLMSLVGTTLIKTAIFHERLATNRQLDRITFLAAESAIAGSIDQFESDPSARDAVLAGASLETCLQTQGVAREECDRANYVPMDAASAASPVPVAATAHTRYVGNAAIPGYSVDQVFYQQFSTEGRAYYASDSDIPFGHLNRQVWRRIDTATGVFQQQ